jgi:hypothetical protein
MHFIQSRAIRDPCARSLPESDESPPSLALIALQPLVSGLKHSCFLCAF